MLLRLLHSRECTTNYSRGNKYTCRLKDLPRRTRKPWASTTTCPRPHQPPRANAPSGERQDKRSGRAFSHQQLSGNPESRPRRGGSRRASRRQPQTPQRRSVRRSSQTRRRQAPSALRRALARSPWAQSPQARVRQASNDARAVCFTAKRREEPSSRRTQARGPHP